MAKAPATRTIGFRLTFDLPSTLRTLGVVLVVLKLLGLAPIGWSVAMGLIPGYGHGNAGMSLDERRAMLVSQWAGIMPHVEANTGFLVSAMLSDARVLYPTALGCPHGGEHVVVLSGSSNPTKVSPDQFDAYVQAVETAVHLLRDAMGQNSVRIEFVRIARSSYFRADGRY